MSTSKKPSLRKRKRQSPPPATTSHISRRLEKLRSGQRNLWDGDDDNDGGDGAEQQVQAKTTIVEKTYVLLTDSDDEKASSQQRSRSNKLKKKSSRIQDENFSSDNDHKITSKCATCLICSILTTLTSYNCCSKHLSVLLHNKNPYHNHQKQTSDTNQWPPQQVMILPMTDEIIQRYLNPQEIYRLRTQTPTSPTQKKSVEPKRSTRKLTKKSTMASDPSDNEHSNIIKSKSSIKCSHIEPEQINSSSSFINDSALPNSGAILPDTTFTVITSTSTTINSFESPNVLDTCQLQQSSDQPIIIDDSQPDSLQENLLAINHTNENKQNDPWTPISDDTYAAMEVALNQVDQSSQDQPEFTPVAARRTPTELMASCLPKIQLKKGRFRQGKPIADKNTPDTTTNECHSMTISQLSSSSSSSTSSSISVIITNSTRPPPSLATIVEDESLIIQSTRQISDKSSQSSHALSERQDNTSEGLSDTIMNGLLAQDELSQHDHIHITTKTVSNEALLLPPPAIIIDDYSGENDINKSIDISQSSQLTNDQSDNQPVISSTTNEKTTPARMSYRFNPDGSRVSISRPPLSTTQQSPVISLRRVSIDVLPITSRTTK